MFFCYCGNSTIKILVISLHPFICRFINCIGTIFCKNIYNFGNLPVFISFGSKRHNYELDHRGVPVEHKYVDAKFVLDERIVDGHYYATVFKYMNKLIQNPELLEVPPEVVKEDLF